MPGSSVASGILAWPDSTSGRTAKRGRRIRTLVPQCRAGFRLAFLARAAGRLVSRSRFKSRSCLAATIQELVRFPQKGTAMIELTEEQRQEVSQANGEATRAIDPESKQEYVLIRAELYEHIKTLLYGDSDWTPEEQLTLLAESGKRAGWDDPAMDVYDNYDENHKKLCP